MRRTRKSLEEEIAKVRCETLGAMAYLQFSTAGEIHPVYLPLLKDKDQSSLRYLG